MIKMIRQKIFKPALIVCAALIVFATSMMVTPVRTGMNVSVNINTANACVCCLCGPTCAPHIKKCSQSACTCQSKKDTDVTKKHITDEFIKHRKWIMKILWEAHVLPTMMLMTEQITTFAVHQMLILGSFFDAKHQLETQRLLQEMQALAHKEYQPSEGMCRFGTNTRSLAAADRNTDLAQISFSAKAIQRQLLSGDVMSAGDEYGDRLSRLQQLKDKYCNPKDFGNGMGDFCTNSDKTRMNKDVDYTHTMEYENTADIDFATSGVTPDEADMMALGNNLYGHEIIGRIDEDKMIENGQIIDPGAFAYLKARSFIAKRSVAQSAFAAQAADRALGENKTLPYMKAILETMGIGEDDIKVILGEQRPSYYAQMEILTKKLYQWPEFYADLYDKPVNVDRKRVAMQAIDLMQKRDMYRSKLRSEAIMAVWLETQLREIEEKYVNEANKGRQALKPLELDGLK
jgi:hypothetical protein